MISEIQNQKLNSKFLEVEIHIALFQLHPNKAPSLYGFPAGFYQKCWHIIGHEMVEALEAARNGGKFLKEINNTFIVMIPKKENIKILQISDQSRIAMLLIRLWSNHCQTD